MAGETGKVPEVVLLKSEIEAAAARVAERAMNDTWQGASGFLGDVFGGLVGDRIKQWRTRNLVDALAQTKDHLESKGVSIEKAKSLPMGELLVIFEGAASTEDVDLRKMWSALLSNGMNPDVDTFIDPSFPRLLSSLSGLDARVLHYLKSFAQLAENHRAAHTREETSILGMRNHPQHEEVKARADARRDSYINSATLLRKEIAEHYSDLNVAYSLFNLIRLGLVTSGSGMDDDDLVRAEMRYEEVHVIDKGLRRELTAIWQRFDLLSEDNKSLPVLTSNSRFMKGAPVPEYYLTGLAERFLVACT